MRQTTRRFAGHRPDGSRRRCTGHWTGRRWLPARLRRTPRAAGRPPSPYGDARRHTCSHLLSRVHGLAAPDRLGGNAAAARHGLCPV
jgi:hypothetical protein